MTAPKTGGVLQETTASAPAPTAEALFLEGSRLMAGSDLGGAAARFREAIRLVPGFAKAHANLGLILDREGMRVEAEQHYRHALLIDPNLGTTEQNLGALLLEQKRLDGAEAAFRRALAIDPASPAAWTHLGVLLACRKVEAEAERCHRVALALAPAYRPASFNLSYLLLRQGRFEEGWQRLEARQWYASLDEKLSCPRWRGESLEGRSLLIGFEAGHGDMIQFGRFAAAAKERGAARVTLACHPALARVCATMAGVDDVLPFDRPFSPAAWAYWVAPLSMPHLCGTRLDSIPADIPYLTPDAAEVARWAARLAPLSPSGELRVGLVWKGNPLFENDADRSLPHLEFFAPLGECPEVRFFSLQKGAGEEEAAHPPARLPLVDLAPEIRDFADTAAIVANLDLVVSVDTAVAHLAGALGKACWVLLPDYKTDWRWLTGRTDSPWYPGVMRLFRQPAGGGWSPVIAEVATALRTCTRRSSP